MKLDAHSLRVMLAIVGAGCASVCLGCLNQRHLVGEGRGSDSGAAGEAGTGGSAGAPPIGSDGATGGSTPAPDGSVDVTTDATPPGATVVGLGDEVSAGWPIAIPPDEVARRL